MSTRRGSWAVLAALLAVVLLTAGCGGLPTSSQVARGLEVGAPEVQPIRLQFEAPPQGATPQQIVEGFLAASWSGEEDFAAARAYLTTAASERWAPRSHVVVYSGSEDISITPTEEAEVEIRAPITARVDSSGRYHVATPDEVDAATVGLVEVDGEWRIDRVPDGFGVWLSQFYFERAFQSMRVSYTDPGSKTLVSDFRWFPIGPGLATSLARAQLGELPGCTRSQMGRAAGCVRSAGRDVPDYLRGAAITGFPAGTTLAVDSVPVVDQVALIELTREALESTPDQRAAAWAQMLQTMRQVPGVSAVSLSVDGSPLQVMGVEGLPTTVGEVGYAPPEPVSVAIVLREGENLRATDFTGWLRGGENQRAITADLPDVEAEWGPLAISRDLTQVAGVDAERARMHRWGSTGEGSPAPFGTGLTEPAYDASGRLWIGGVDEAGEPRVWWFAEGDDAAQAPRVLPTAWLDGEVVAVKPSPGGRRLAVAVQDGAGEVALHVIGIPVADEASDVASAVERPWTVASGLVDLRDLTWVDDATLGAVTARGSAPVSPVIVPLGGPVEELTQVRDARSIVTSGGERGVVVVNDDGHVWRRVGNGWQDQGRVDDLIVPGT